MKSIIIGIAAAAVVLAPGASRGGRRVSKAVRPTTVVAPIAARQAAARALADADAGWARLYGQDWGTSVVANPLIDSVPFAVQTEIAAQLSALDARPPERLLYFAWIQEQVPDLTSDGWYGYIQSITAAGVGYVVEVSFSPALSPPEGGDTTIEDDYHETYHYQGGVFQFIGGRASECPTRLLVTH